METYAKVAQAVQFWGLLLFLVLFATALVYALKPSNKKKFDDAARMPLRDD